MLYTIKLTSFNNDEIIMIDLCMRMCGMDMAQAATVVDHMPSVLARNVDEDKVEEFEREFKNVGATLQVISSDEEASLDPADEVNVSGVYEPMTEDNDDQQKAVYQEPEYQQAEYQEGDYQQEEYQEGEYLQQEYQEYDVQAEQEYQQDGGFVESEDGQSEQSEDNPQSVVQMNQEQPDETVVEEPALPEGEEEEEYINYGSCPRCGSTFVTVKKASSLFGGVKVKCVCDVCKHKF